MNDATTVTWTGWFRRSRHSPWRAVCQAESEAGCLDLLLTTVRESGDSVVLPAHRHPDQKPVRKAP